MKRPTVINRFDGGWSTDKKIGAPNSFYYSKHIDFRKNPTQLSILPETAKESSTTVTGLITEMLQMPSGKIVAIDDAGGVYTRSTGGTWTKNGTTLDDTSMGMGYNRNQDTIWIPGTTTLHSITNADTIFSGGTFTPASDQITALLDTYTSDHANTYTTTNAINEGWTHKLSITPTREPQYSVKIWVTTKGTDDLTLTWHDSANNTLGTSTIANANITNGALNEFVFSSPIRTTSGINGASYHCHITHASASSSTIGTATASDFADAHYEQYADRLVNPKNGMHPVQDFLQYMCIGNERYLAVWEVISSSTPGATEFQQHKLTFPQGYEVCGLSVWTEYLAIACEKRSSSATNEFQDGKIFLWDGVSLSPNVIIDIPEGAPYGLYSHQNILRYYAGGAWYAWAGGNPVKIWQMPNTDTEFTDVSTYFINYPHTQAVRNGVLLGAFPSVTTSTTVEHGVYSFGSRNRNFSDSFGLSYTMSTGNTTNGTLRLGCLKSFGDKMLLSWRDDSSYGVDVVSPTSDPFGTASWQSMIMDNGRPDKQKKLIEIRVEFEALPSGATVTPQYQIDRSGSFTSGTAATAGDTSITLNVNKLYKELQVGLSLVATTATPVITGITIIWEDLSRERD